MGSGHAAIVMGALLTGLPSAASADDACRVQNVDYHGWKCVELSNGRIDVVVAPQLGGRIIQLRLGDVEVLWVNPKLAGKVVLYATGRIADAATQKKPPDWANYGGDKLWPAPQGFDRPDQWPGPPDPVHKGGTVDNGKYELTVLASGPAEAAVRMASPRDLYAGIRFIREIRVRPRTTTVELTATMVNVVDRPVRWGIWQVTQHAGHVGTKGAAIRWDRSKADVQAWSPLDPASRYPKGYYVMFGPKDNPQFLVDDALAAAGVKLFRLDYQYRVGKVGSDNTDGWLAVTHQRSGVLYAHTFPPAATRDHPDGASVEFWASGPGQIQLGDKTVELAASEPLLIESEVLSPFADLEPGKRFSYATQIHLARGTGPVANVTKAGAEIKPVSRCPVHGCMGRIAVFRDGQVQLAGAKSAEPIPLAEVRAGELIDLAKLASAAKIRDARTVRLIDAKGRPVGAWPIRGE